MRTAIDTNVNFQQALWLDAGRRFARYAKRRRTNLGEGSKRLLVDSIISSHALSEADRFMTLDQKRYKQDFPEMTLI